MKTLKAIPLGFILRLFTLTRVLLLLVSYFGIILLHAKQYSSISTLDANIFFSSWKQWDAANYVRIAQFGYGNIYDLAFFPFYPLLIAAIGSIFGNYTLVGMLISNVALLGALFFLYQLALEVANEQVARRTLLYLCIFPTAFYFFAAYNESLFLFLATGAFLAIRRSKWWVAGLLGLFAACTRFSGILLVIPYLYEFWLSQKEQRPLLSVKAIGQLLPLGLIPLGTALYSYYCWHVTGNPLMFATVQAHWGRTTSWPWQSILLALYQLFWVQPFGSFYQVHTLLDLSATLGFIFLTIVGYRLLPKSYTLWSICILLPLLISATTVQADPLVSNQRIVIEIFPAFIALAMLSLKHPRLHQAVTLVFPVLLATLTFLFVWGFWMV